jgi:F-type H+-transporting ATPase subunit b
VNQLLTTLAHAESSHAEAGGLAALGLDVKTFLFQLITFVLLLLILRKWAFPVLVKTLEDRRKAVEKSIDQAKQTEAALQNAEKQITQMLREARDQAEELVAAGHKEAAAMIEDAETKAAKRAEHIVRDAHTSMQNELSNARTALKQETAKLVAEATGVIIKEKVDARKNSELVTKAIAEVAKGKK